MAATFVAVAFGLGVGIVPGWVQPRAWGAPRSREGGDCDGRHTEEAGRSGPLCRGLPGLAGWAGLHAADGQEHVERRGPVGVWMSRAGLVMGQLDEDAMVVFLAARRAGGAARVAGLRAMRPLLSSLREVGVTPAARAAPSPLGALLGEYRTWMVQERGLAASTVLRYQNTAARFLEQHAVVDGMLNVAGLTGADVNVFLLGECGRVSVGSAKGRVGELRAVLRFLYLQGLTPLRLGERGSARRWLASGHLAADHEHLRCPVAARWL